MAPINDQIDSDNEEMHEFSPFLNGKELAMQGKIFDACKMWRHCASEEEGPVKTEARKAVGRILTSYSAAAIARMAPSLHANPLTAEALVSATATLVEKRPTLLRPCALRAALGVVFGQEGHPQRKYFTNLCLKQCVAPDAKTTRMSCEGFEPLFRGLSKGELSEIVPALTRMLKRSSGSSLPVAKMLLEEATADVSTFAADLFPALLDCVKAGDTEIRGKGVECMGALVSHMGDFEKGVGGLVSELLGLLPQSKLSMPAQRVGVLLSLAAMTSPEPGCCTRKEKRAVYGQAAASAQLLKLTGDGNEDLRVSALQAVSALVGASGMIDGTVSSALQESVVKTLADKKASDRVRLVALQGLYNILRSIKPQQIEDLSFLHAALASLGAVSVVAQTRPGAKKISFLSWAILTRLAADPNVERTLVDELEKVIKPQLSTFTSASSFVTKFENLDALSSEEIGILSEATSNLLKLPFFSPLGRLDPPNVTLPSLSGLESKNFFLKFLLKLESVGGKVVLPDEVVSDDFATQLGYFLYDFLENSGPEVSAVELRRAFKLFQKPFQHCGGEALGLTLLAMHHPRTRTQKSAHVFFSHFFGDSLTALLEAPEKEEVVAAAVELLLQGGEVQIKSEAERACREGCLQALVSVVSAEGEKAGLTRKLFEKLMVKIKEETKKIGQEKEVDVKIFFHDEGKLWREEGVYMGEMELLTKDDKEESKPVKPTSRPVGAKAKAKTANKPGGKTKQDIEKDLIQSQSRTRARILKNVSAALFAFSAFSRLCVLPQGVKEGKRALSKLEEDRVISTLLGSPLTSIQTRSDLRKVVELVHPSEVPSRRLLPDLLFQAAVREVSSEEVISLCEEIQSPLPAHVLGLLAPLMSLVLRSEDGSPLLAAAQPVLEFLNQQASWNVEFSKNILLDDISCIVRTLPPTSRTAGDVLKKLSGYLFSEVDLRKICEMSLTNDESVRGIVVDCLVVLKSKVDVSGARTFLGLLAMDSEHEEISKKAAGVMEASSLRLDFEIVKSSLEFLSSTYENVRTFIARLCCSVFEGDESKENLGWLLDDLISRFTNASESGQLAVGLIMEKSAKHLSEDVQQLAVLQFILESALPTPLPSSVVDQLLSAGMSLIEAQGQGGVHIMTEACEKLLAKKGKSENVSLALAVFLGALCKHLNSTDDKVASVREQLIKQIQEAKHVSVQRKICQVLPPLIKAMGASEESNQLFQRLLDSALGSADASVRFGSAFAVGATIKARGVSSLRQLEVLKKLQEAAEDKKSPNCRQGALRVYDALSFSLGRLFEPYVSSTLPVLLVALSDGNPSVREASTEAADQIMANLSAHGIKLVLPSLLLGITDRQWRTKLGSVGLLSSMVNCAPKQLASCLPQIVPALSEAATDTHAKVKDSAADSLSKIGGVIGNPEIKSLVPQLVSSLTQPADDKLSRKALDALLSTSFVHSVDTASLALVIPVVVRAFKDRSAELKQKASQIVGSMALLVNDPKDSLGPYLPLVTPPLQQALTDPIPDVRSTAAKAFGTLTRVVPVYVVTEVLPWLYTTVVSPAAQVERAGAANGLAEVMVALGTDRVQEILPGILNKCGDLQAVPEVREGYLGLFIFLPSIMKAEFSTYLSKVFPVILAGLGDNHQSVREVARRAAAGICTLYAATHSTLLMGPLEGAMFDEDWRIRYAAVQLFGGMVEAMLKTTRGVSSENLMECEVLTKEKRSYMLASLYVVRSDDNSMVRHQAQMAWKAMVSNTPRTLRELLPILTKRLINNLSSQDAPRQAAASRCVGDLVQKLAERVLPEIMPILMKSLDGNADANTRSGVCVGLAEIIKQAGKPMLSEYLGQLLPAIQKVICDESEAVRKGASKCVTLLHSVIGLDSLDTVVPSLVSRLLKGDETAHLGLTELLLLLPSAVFPIVCDPLVKPPPTLEKVRGMSILASAPCSELNKKLHLVLRALEKAGEEHMEAVEEVSKSIFEVLDDKGREVVISELSRCLKDADSKVFGCRMLNCLMVAVASQEEDLSDYLDLLLPLLLPIALAEENNEILKIGFESISSLAKHVSKERLVLHISTMKDCIFELPGENLPGLSLPGGLDPFFPTYQHALMQGSLEERETAADALGDLVKRCAPEKLRLYAVKLTGPLIRVLGDRFTSNVKSAILRTLLSLMERCGAALKPFIPQLQTSYLKCMSDASNSVRLLASLSLQLLAKDTLRVDDLLNELASHAKADDPDVAICAMNCLGGVLGGSLKKPPSEACQKKLGAALHPKLLDRSDDGPEIRQAAAKALAGLKQEALALVDSLDISAKSADWASRHGYALLLSSLASLDFDVSPFAPQISALLEDDRLLVRKAALSAVASSEDLLKAPEVRTAVAACCAEPELAQLAKSILAS